MPSVAILVDRLQLMFEWYKGMVDEGTGRLLYVYDPENDATTGDGEPIRDIAAVWDVEVVSAFLGRDDLRDLIRRSLDHFGQLVVERDGYAIVAPRGDPRRSAINRVVRPSCSYGKIRNACEVLATGDSIQARSRRHSGAGPALRLMNNEGTYG